MSDQPDKQPQQPATTPDKAENKSSVEEKKPAPNNGSAIPSDAVVEPQDKPATPAKAESPSEAQPPAKTAQEEPPAPKPEPTSVKSDAPAPASPPASDKPAVEETPQETVKGEPLTASPTRKLEMPPPLVPSITPTVPSKPEDGVKRPDARPVQPVPTQGPSTAPLPDSLRTSVPAKPPTTSAGQICPNCGHLNRPGILFCENCGTNLMTGKQPAIGTRDLQREQQTAAQDSVKLLDTSETKAIDTAGSSTFTENMVLRVEIEGAATPMLVYPKQEIILGRRDPNTGAMPDVDLTAYAGYRMGVSRRHAAIRFQERQLNVSDLGSSNGTFLNGTRLNAHRPYQLRDGDEIRLGQMVMRLFFQSNQK